MSYARDEESIKANEKAYAEYRSKVKYGTLRSEADGNAVQALIAGTTKDGIRVGGFDQGGLRSGQNEMGSAADEINYRINKHGTFTMKDYKDMTTMGGRVNDEGVLVRKNAGDIKTRHGHGPGSMSHTAHAIDDMIHNSSLGGKTYKFDDDVVDYVAGKRKEVDDRKAAQTAARDLRKEKIRAGNERRRAEAHAAGKPYGSIEEAAFKRKAEDEKAQAEGPEAVKALAAQRSQQEEESRTHDRLVQKRRSGGQLTCAEQSQLGQVSDKCKAEAHATAQRRMAEAKQRAQEFKTKTKETTDRLSATRKARQQNANNGSYNNPNANRFNSGQEQTTTSANSDAATSQPDKYDFRSAASRTTPQSWNTRGKSVGRFGKN